MVREITTMGAERERTTSKPLHNFTLPLSLKWGNQRHLRCMKLDADSSTKSPAVDHHHEQQQNQQQQLQRQQQRQPRRSPPQQQLKFNNNNGNHSSSSSSMMMMMNSTVATRQQRRLMILEEEEEEEEGGDDPMAVDGGEEEGGIEAVRERIMMDLKTEADKMKDAIFRGKQPQQTQQLVLSSEEEQERDKRTEEFPAAVVVERPWNLRTRRASVSNAAIGIGGGGSSNNNNINNNNSNCNKGLLRFGEEKKKGILNSPEKEPERPKFSLTLTKKEIEEDFMTMLGHKPPRRPKKRPRAVQKQMDTLFPGMWLTEVTADAYKVDPPPENGKR